jgi:hypothetical protein
MELDFKVRSRFVKRSMGRRRDNPLSDRAHIFNVYTRRNETKAYISGS